MTSVLILGATGHLGGSLLTGLHETRSDISITAYIRSNTSLAAHDIIDMGIKTVFGTFEETEKLVATCSEHTVVINAANSSDITLTSNILSGLKLQSRDSSRLPILIHVSGAGNFSDGGKTGSFNPESKLWDDANQDDVKQISSSMKNGGPDEMILRADAARIVDGFIVCPVGIHGRATDTIRTSSHGVIITRMMKNVIDLGFSPYVGDGTAVFQMVHIDDVVSLTSLVLDKALSGKIAPSAYGRYYVAEGREHSWREMATALGDAMFAANKITKPQASSVPLQGAGFLGPV